MPAGPVVGITSQFYSSSSEINRYVGPGEFRLHYSQNICSFSASFLSLSDLGTGDLYIPRGDDANAGRVWKRNNASTRDKANGKMGWEVGSIPYSIIQYQYV